LKDRNDSYSLAPLREGQTFDIRFYKEGQNYPKKWLLSRPDPGSWGIYLYYEAERFDEVLTIL
jgi:hypothetical protein